jgi:DNA replication licensing factor MCM6
MDRSSSPAFLRSSLPPSSAPPHATSSQTPRRTRPSTDALALDDVPTDPAQDEAGPSRRRGARARGTLNNDVSLVRDVLGDSVTESFETFLKTCVSAHWACHPRARASERHTRTGSPKTWI